MSEKAKSRYFTFLLYPESIPEDWLLKLELTDIPMAISPLHDKDKKEGKEKGFKKPHYHVVYIAKNPVTAHSVRMRIKRALGDDSIAKVQIIKTTVENMYLYLTHESKDAIEKNKYVYDKKDIILINNFDIDRYITLDVEEKEEMFNLVCDLIDDYNLANIRELRRFIKLRGSEFGITSMSIVNSVLRSHTGLVRLYFDGVYQERRYGRSDVNKETGELE